ncbi:glycosyltransferase [Methylobacterium sp. E-016]|uniref:glycosyltransferase family 4 protein n=1 Tax=Methylobacterium sp. E-016 TaxID=2836556 RepID=UPI001FB9E58A|nr:glycosyltransferase [Methylobacterium sp. E-016]MCJ2078923.1 glycosyltransferase [Methylobacterium sp. E-016]
MQNLAFFTIISKNYLSSAVVLMRSLSELHPESRRFVFLCDKEQGYDITRDYYELINLDSVGIPLVEVMVNMYTIMEMNTAIKPFCFRFLFSTFSFSSVIYLDPDILAFERLTEAMSLLEHHDAVVTPHILTPYFDSAAPSELNIIRSGVYNFGFLGLSNRSNVELFVTWWEEKLFSDCVVDLPNGLFVDQKWGDLLPSFCDCYVMKHPGYNVAYWNLHERDLQIEGDRFFCCGLPLVFFHFSGFNPLDKEVLSRHQNRYRHPFARELQLLLEKYASLVVNEGHTRNSQLPYYFSEIAFGLPNNKILNWIFRTAIKSRRSLPSPAENLPEFLIYICTADYTRRDPLPLISQAFLATRPDVGKAFPLASQDPQDVGFRTWMLESGLMAEGLGLAVSYFGESLQIGQNRSDEFALLSRVIMQENLDLLQNFKNMFVDRAKLQYFLSWCRQRLGFPSLDENDQEKDCEECMISAAKILHLYFQLADVRQMFSEIWNLEVGLQFCSWLEQNRDDFNFSLRQISLVKCFLLLEKEYIRHLGLCYTKDVVDENSGANEWVLTSCESGSEGGACALIETPVSLGRKEPKCIVDSTSDSASSYRSAYAKKTISVTALFSPIKAESAGRLDCLEVESVSGTSHRMNNKLKINLAGFFHSHTGMGESARSMLRTLESGNFDIRCFVLPDFRSVEPQLLTEEFFGTYHKSPDCSIIIANADTVTFAMNFLPADFHGRFKCGYWVWETEKLPTAYESLGRLFDEIWSPSAASAAAISETIRQEVRVVPHAVEFSAADVPAVIKTARAKKLVLGFMFDCKSVIERKNPLAIIDACDRARDLGADIELRIKIMGRDDFDFRGRRILDMLHRPYVEFFYCPMGRNEVRQFILGLDAYISLHRFEGFGLTIAEAMALGKPVIATRYSGNLQFMSDENSYLVDCDVLPTARAFGPYSKGSLWAEPDINAAAEYILQLHDSDRCAEIGAKAAESVRIQLSPSSVLKKFVEPALISRPLIL